MTTSRTYRFLSALLAAVLILGAAVPSVQAVCAAIYSADLTAEAMPMPCHDSGEVNASDAEQHAQPVTLAAEAGNDWPPCCVLTASHHVLAADDTVLPARLEAPLARVTMQETAHTALQLRSSQAPAPPLVVPSSSDRSVLLSTFLI